MPYDAGVKLSPRALSIVALLALSSVPTAQAAPFDRVVLSTEYLSEGANVGDFNADGVTDVVSGPYWWEGPHHRVRHTIYAPVVYPVTVYAAQFATFVHDVNGDGWDDVITTGIPAQASHWYQNPQTPDGTWVRHVLFPSVGTEAPLFEQLIPGGAPELVCGASGLLGYLTQDPSGSFVPWQFHPIAASPFPLAFFHGLGVGDVNGDGRKDVLTGAGWLEQPASLDGDPAWASHPWPFGVLEGAQMYAYDVDGDGDADVISSRDAHGYGLSWFEQVPAAGGPDFVEHVILPTQPVAVGVEQFSQLHALELVDVDGDGLRDLVTGKAFYAHNGTDPGADDPAVVHGFKLVRGPNGPIWFQVEFDDEVGIGRQFVVADANDDGRPDVIVGNKKGVHLLRRASLWGNVSEIQIATGGVQTLFLDAGQPGAFGVYVILGSLSGTTPGIPFGGALVPLFPDAYTLFTLTNAQNPLFFAGFLGVLDQNGRAVAEVRVPPGMPWVGPLDANYSFLLWGPGGTFLHPSNAASLRIL